MLANILLTSVIVLSSTIHQDGHEYFSEESHLTSSGSNSINLLRQELMSQLRADYMKSDAFFQRWLKSNDFDVPKTRKNLQKFIEWRQENLFGKQRRDLSLEGDIPIQIIKDKQGNLVVYHDMSITNLRKLVEQNQIEQFPIQIMKAIDTALETNYAHHQAERSVGVLVDWTGFNREEHLCPRCIQAYFEIVKKYEANYPLTVNRVVFFNTPRSFKKIIKAMKPLMSEQLWKAYVVFGTDQLNQGKRYLEDWVGKANLPASIRL